MRVPVNTCRAPLLTGGGSVPVSCKSGALSCMPEQAGKAEPPLEGLSPVCRAAEQWKVYRYHGEMVHFPACRNKPEKQNRLWRACSRSVVPRSSGKCTDIVAEWCTFLHAGPSRKSRAASGGPVAGMTCRGAVESVPISWRNGALSCMPEQAGKAGPPQKGLSPVCRAAAQWKVYRYRGGMVHFPACRNKPEKQNRLWRACSRCVVLRSSGKCTDIVAEWCTFRRGWEGSRSCAGQSADAGCSAKYFQREQSIGA